MNPFLNERSAGRTEYLLSADERRVSVSQDARRELLGKFRGMIEAIRKLEKENRELRDDLKKIRDEFDEYRRRHPKTAGVRNGKAYTIQQNREKDEGDADGGGRKPGAQPGHKPNSRERAEPDWTGELPVHFATEYLIQRRWCGRCCKFVEASAPDVLPGSTIDLRTMPVIVYMRIALRLPVGQAADAMERLLLPCLAG